MADRSINRSQLEQVIGLAKAHGFYSESMYWDVYNLEFAGDVRGCIAFDNNSTDDTFYIESSLLLLGFPLYARCEDSEPLILHGRRYRIECFRRNKQWCYQVFQDDELDSEDMIAEGELGGK